MHGWQNFDLELFDHDTVGNAESVHVRVARSPAGVQRDPVRVAIPDWLRRGASAIARASVSLEQTVTLGEGLAAILLPGMAAELFDTSRARLADGEGLRLRIELRSLALADLPWEYAWRRPLDSDAQTPERGFLALDRTLSIVRYEPVAQPPREFAPLGDAPLELALLLANPRVPGMSTLDLDSEIAAIEAAVHQRSDIALQIHRNATSGALYEALDGRPHVLHFAGHGQFKMRPAEEFGTFVGDGQLLFETAGGDADPVSARELSAKMRGCGLRLAVLNSCETARRDGLNAFTGVAPLLVREGVPAVVAMQFRIRDEHALHFARRFYHNLVAHESIDAAVTAARLAMFDVDDGFHRDWGIPVLYLRSEQSVLFPDPAARVPTTPRRVGPKVLLNLGLSAVLVFALAFVYLRHVEPRLPFGSIVGGVLAAALVIALTWLTTVAGSTLRDVLLSALDKRRATGALALAIAAAATAAWAVPPPIGVRVVAGKNLLALLPAADLANPVRTYQLRVQGRNRSAVAADLRQGGVTLAGSGSLAGRLTRRHDAGAGRQMQRYLQQHRLETGGERFLAAWQGRAAPLGLRGFARGGPLKLTVERDGEVLSCHAVDPADLVDDMTVIFMENGDVCP